MGLDTTHDAWHDPYSAFYRWRRAVAKAIDINIDEMYGFTESGKPWPKHPLTALLYHSDCDGYLTPGQCGKIADGLEAIADTIAAGDDDVVYLREKTRAFIAGCRLAHKQKRRIIFHYFLGAR